jgi:hypothetical protein
MARDQDACAPFNHGDPPELGLCMVEQLIKLTRLGIEDFQTIDGLTTHDEQLLSRGIAPKRANPLIAGVRCF